MIDLRSSTRVRSDRVDVPARTAVALARVVVGVIGIVIVIGVVIDIIIVSSSSRRSLSRSFVPFVLERPIRDPSDRSVMAFPGGLV